MIFHITINYYADDRIVYTYPKNIQLTAKKLTSLNVHKIKRYVVLEIQSENSAR